MLESLEKFVINSMRAVALDYAINHDDLLNHDDERYDEITTALRDNHVLITVVSKGELVHDEEAYEHRIEYQITHNLMSKSESSKSHAMGLMTHEDGSIECTFKLGLMFDEDMECFFSDIDTTTEKY